MRQRSDRAFTLIELLIAVAVVGILAVIAYPSYLGYVARANRAVAKSQLTQIAAREELYFQDNKQYTGSLTALGFGADSYCLDNRGNPVSCESAQGIYRFEVNSTPLTYVATATPLGRQASQDSRCAGLGINERGEKSADASDCW